MRSERKYEHLIKIKRKWAIIITQLSEAKATLRNIHALTERQYKGDVNAICTLVDLSNAVRLAKLTDRQTEALRYVYGADMTQASAGQRMGITREAVKLYANDAIDKIDAVYEYIAWHNGDINEGDFIDDEVNTTISA